jgi:4-amino-4-deoxy-L-arabinose transferase-like glycosyltransferase
LLAENPHNAVNSRLKQDLQYLLLILLPFFLLFIGWRPLSVPDEGRYPEVALEMLLTGDFITPRINGIVFLDKPALYYWLQAFSFHLFGVSQWSIRLMPALFGVLGVTIVFITAWQLFSRRAAWWSATILATNPLYFLAAQYADMNLEIAVLVTAALCLFLLGRREPVGSIPRRYLFWLAWMAMGFGILTKGLIGLVFPGMIAGCWAIMGWRWRELLRWHLISGLIVLLAVCLPWFMAVQKQNPQFFHYFFIYQQFERFSGTGFNNEFPFWFYLPVMLCGLLPWSVWLPKALVNQTRCAIGKTALSQCSEERQILLLWPLLILIFFSLPASKIVGYILPTLPPLALLLGDYLDRKLTLAEQTGTVSFAVRHTKYLAVIGIAISFALLLVVPRFEPNGIKTLVEALQNQRKDGDSIISYRNYYQDLPLYLHQQKTAQPMNFQPMMVVDNWNDPDIMKEDNWRREFYLGLQNQPDARKWLIDESAFANKLQEAGARIFVLSSYRNEQELTSRFGLHVIARTKKNLLLATSAISTTPQSQSN